MYIKEIAVENFKSYRHRNVIKLDKGHNVLFGRNGSGKSNIGYALALILSATRRKLTKLERESLINTGSRANSTTIELIISPEFESTPDFTLKRVISLKSDQFYLDNTAITHDQHYDFICRYFTPNSPFYLVFQGDIETWAISCSKASHLLDTLVNVLGVGGVDEIFTDSVDKIASEKEKQEEKRVELSTLETKVAKDAEKFTGWNIANKKRRFLEHKLLDLMRINLEHELKDLEQPLEEEKMKILDAEVRYAQAEEAFIAASDDQETWEQARNQERKLLDRLQAEKHTIQEELATLQEEVKNLEEKLNADADFSLIDKKNRLQEEITRLKTKKMTLMNEFQQIKESHHEKLQNYTENRLKIAAIARKKRIATEIQDGSDVTTAITKINEQIRVQEDAVDIQRIEVSHLEERKFDDERKLLKKQENIEEIRKNLPELRKRKVDLGQSRNHLLDKQKNQQKELAELHELIEIDLRENMKLQKDLNFFVRPELLQGIQSVEKILNKWQDEERVYDVEGVFGLVLENFKPERAVVLAAEVAAGDRLFHYIVRDRELILKFQKELEELPGLVSFIPLANVKNSDVNYPENSETIPLISRIEFLDKNTEKVVKSIFSRTIIVRNLARGAELVHHYPKFKFITLQGSQVLSQGHFRSGFADSSTSRIKIFQDFRKSTEQLNKRKKEYKKINNNLENLRHSLLEVLTALQKIDLEIYQEEEKLSQLLREIPKITNNIDISTKNYDSGVLFLEELRAGLEALQATRHDLQTNLHDLQPALLQEHMTNLEIGNQQKKKIIHESERKVGELESSLKNIDLELTQHENLLRNLEAEPGELPLEEIRENLTKNHRKIEKLEEKSVKIGTELDQTRAQLEQLELEIIKKRRILRDAKFQKTILENDLKSAKIGEQSVLSQISEIQEKLTELEEKEQNMATVPTLPNPQEFDELSRKQLEQRIQQLKRKEASFGDVLTVYHTESEKNLKEIRKIKEIIEETTENIEKMEEIIDEERENLNLKKLKTLDWALNELNKKFCEIFRKIIKNGTVKIYPINSKGKRILDDEIPWDNVKNLKIRASFSGDDEHMDDLIKLSGGQKTIIGLCLLIAIRQICMAPFFYFDEIDRALDDEWRDIVANLVRDFSKLTQIISITFRKEFLCVADKFFKVSTVNGCSRIVESDLDEAVGFVDKDAAEDES